MKLIALIVLLTSCTRPYYKPDLSELTTKQKDAYFSILEEAEFVRSQHKPHDNYQFLSYLQDDLSAADVNALERVLPKDISVDADGFTVDMNIEASK